MAYLKKKKMYQMAGELIGKENMCKLGGCTYKFYHGSEWLTFSNKEQKTFYKLYRCKNYIAVDVSEYDDYYEVLEENVNRVMYVFVNDRNVYLKKHERHDSGLSEVVQIV